MITNTMDFAVVERLRKHMLLPSKDFAAIVGVSRQTYHTWVKGVSTPRAKHVDEMRQVMRKLVVIMREHAWPSSEVLVMEPAERLEHLQGLLTQAE